MTKNLKKKKATRRAWTLANREKLRASARVWRNKNKDKIRKKRKNYRVANQEYLKKWQKNYCRKNKDKIRAYWHLTQYGLTSGQFQNLLSKQKNRCGICREKFDKIPHVDHCHKTRKVRGLLCAHCNQGLGHFRDSKKRLRCALKYL